MKTLLCIVDGLGVSENPHFTIPFIQKNLHRGVLLNASGKSVGLTDGQMGNSEVGHMTIGSGRIIKQNLTRIDDAISDGTFPPLFEANTYHLIGLLSDGGVHSHINHLVHLIKALKGKRIYLHLISDGRDTAPQSFEKYWCSINDLVDENCVIATINGRYYAMDRDNRHNRTELAYKAIALGKSEQTFQAVDDLIANYYQKGIHDEFFVPAVNNNTNYNGFAESDAVIFCNFRSDRMRQLVSLIHSRHPGNKIISMVDYFDGSMPQIINAFPSTVVNNTLGEMIAKAGKRQLRIAETEKYAHVTFFLNCGREDPHDNEDRFLIPSPKVSTYDLKPEMSAYEITDTLTCVLNRKEYDFIAVNFANADMVGHTGNPQAAQVACDVLDECLMRISETALENEYIMLITADHGNIEQLYDQESNQPHTAHTLNKVPFICLSNKLSLKLPDSYTPGLRDVAPTVLNIIGVATPSDMTGIALFETSRHDLKE